ncbi:haloacid dehalogenase [Spirochaetia bacterium]|nr:haloacid dehalogenase [Spirochaetia bacterium]
MKCYKLPAHIAALIFDMDGTLYTHEEYLQGQIDGLIRRLGQVRGKSFETMRDAVEAYQDAWARDHGGRKCSLGNSLEAFGISVEESVKWREELIEPGLYIREDRNLQKTLGLLGETFSLAVITNNPVPVARKTLAALGVTGYFPVIIGLDTCWVSKPHTAPFIKAAELLGVPPSACVSIGDRYDIDLLPPLELGMGGILVDGVEDVYELKNLDHHGFSCNP